MGKSLFMTPFVEWCHEDYLFFLVDISDIHTVSNHSILKYEARLECTERHSLESLIHFTKKRLCRLCIQ